MESAGVYRRPVCNNLAQFPGKLKLVLLLVNPRHAKALPGHETGRVDATRSAELLQHGSIRASFVPRVRLEPDSSALIPLRGGTSHAHRTHPDKRRPHDHESRSAF
jgi:hypothetical protein